MACLSLFTERSVFNAGNRPCQGQMFHPAPKIETIVCHASERILRFLQRRGVITLVAVQATAKSRWSPTRA
jgi:hypothetical protein